MRDYIEYCESCGKLIDGGFYYRNNKQMCEDCANEFDDQRYDEQCDRDEDWG